MKSLATLLCLFTLTWTLVPPASARDERLTALDQALARIEAAPAVKSDALADAVAARQLRNKRASGPPSGMELLKPLLAEFERRDAARRAAFELVARKGLQGKAEDRLAAARVAYARGQGRLLQILRRLTRQSKAVGTVAATPEMGLVREAREIVARVQEASRREPLSSGELKLRAPRLQPPALPLREPGSTQAIAVAPSLAAAVPGLDDAAIGSIPKTLRDAAAAFSGPIDAYEWVRNTIRPEFYYGGMKGPLETYLEQSGNDADTAAVLIALLRAKGIPARFVRGTVEWPAATLTEITGTGTAEQGVRVLERAGVPHETVLGAGGVSSVKLARVWAEAYLPYANYRGALLDSQGKGWISLDPGFKRLQAVTGLDVVTDLGFDARVALDAYVSTIENRTPLEFVRGRIGELLAGLKPGTAYGDALNHRDVIPEALRVLPGSLPYPVVDRADVSYALLDELGHTVRIVGEADGLTVLDESFPVSELLGRRFTLSYAPFAAEDRDIADAFGGLARTPPYLVDVKPVLKSAGVVVATGSAPLGMAVQYTLRMEFKTPGGTEVVANTVLAGNLLAIGLGGAKVTGAESGEDQAAAILSARAWSYLDRWNRSDEELANLFRVVPVRPTVSECMAMSDVEVEYAGGDPKYPLSFDWKGIAIDADLRASAPVGLENRESERTFALISGLEGSILENRIFEDDLRIASVSTAKALQLANAQGIEVLDLTQANADSILPGLPLDEGVKAEIREAVDRGLLARVPATEATYLAWTGVGYLLLDEGTGEAAYQLQGGHSGGVTAPAVFDMPADVVTLLQLQGEKPAPEGTEVAKVAKFPYGDFQFGTVHKMLDTPLKVLATDAEGHPVPAAAVTFTVTGGEGGFPVDPSSPDPEATVSETTVLSNDRGEAEVRLVLGRKTGLIPRYYIEDGKEFATQVGMNMVTARAGAAWLPEPFYAFGLPDTQSDGTNEWGTAWLKEYEQWWGWANLRSAGRITVEMTDQYENPLSNWAMTFSYKPDPTTWVPERWPGQMGVRPANTTPGTLLTPKDFDACRAADPDPKWGKCAGESGTVTQKTSAYGRASAYPFLGDSPTSTYIFDVDGPLKPQLFSVKFTTGGEICSPEPTCAAAFGYPEEPVVINGARLIRGNRNGDLVEAYPPGEEGALSFWATVLYEKERIDTYTTPQGEVHYYAVGLNQWERKSLTNSEFKLAPTTPGTQVNPTQPGSDENGRYKATMTMGPQPQLNTVHWEATNAPDRIKYKDGRPPELDAADVNTADWTAKKAPDPKRPESRNAAFSLWGVRPELAGVQPTPVFLTSAASVENAASISYRVLPANYGLLLDPHDLRLELKYGSNVELTGAGGDPVFVIPEGIHLVPGVHEASLTLLGVSANGTDISSAPLAVPVLGATTLVAMTFSGDGYQSVTRDTGTPYELPHWSRANRSPVVFGRATVPAVSLTFSVEGSLPSALPILIKGKGTGALDFEGTGTVVGSLFSIGPLRATAPLADQVDLLDPLRIEWQVSYDGGQTFRPAGVSENRAYVTLGLPSTAAPLYETLLDIGCRNARNHTDEASTVAAIWSDFAGPIPGVRRRDGLEMRYWLPRVGGQCNQYTFMIGDPSANGTCVAWSHLLQKTLLAQGINGATVVQVMTADQPKENLFLVKSWAFSQHVKTGPNGILETTPVGGDQALVLKGNGLPQSPCVGAGPDGKLQTSKRGDDHIDTQTNLIDAGPNGICDSTSAADDVQLVPVGQGLPNAPAIGPSPVDGVLHSLPSGDDSLGDGFFNDFVPNSPFPYFEGFDAINLPGVAGQGDPEPPEAFFNHYIVRYGGFLYDPSYGAGPFASESEHENASIDGIKRQDGRAKKHGPSRQLIYVEEP